MSKCDFCGQEAGLLRKRHKECQDKHDRGLEQLGALTAQAALGHQALASLKERAARVAAVSFIPGSELPSILIQGWEKAVDTALEDDILTKDEENALDAYREHFSLTQRDLDAHHAYTKLVKGGVIRDLLEGKLPERVNISGTIPFNMQKSEALRWAFNDVEYYEERQRTTYSGSYQGASVRVAKGLYYRVGGFRGNPVVTSQIVHMATGVLGITEKHMYFAGGNKAFRIPYGKVVAFTPYSDGIGIQRDATSAKPQVFKTGDGWFTYNLVQNLARMAAA
jgi:hypothetical protein